MADQIPETIDDLASVPDISMLGDEPSAVPTETGGDVDVDINDLAEAPYASFGEKGEAIARGTAKGAGKAASIMGSTMTGGRLGMMAAPFLGPAAPAAPLIGSAGGFTYGLFLSDLIDEYFGKPKKPELLPYEEGAETFGGSVAFGMGAPFAVPKEILAKQSGRIPKLLRSMREEIVARPKSYLGKESMSALWAGLAGGASVAYDPEATGMRMGAELAGGVFGPGRFLFDLKGIADKASGAVFSATAPEAIQQRVAEYLQKIVAEAGEDPEKLTKLLLEQLPKGVGPNMAPNPTAAQKTGSIALGALERTLAAAYQEFGGLKADQATQSLEAYKYLIKALENSGNPAAVKTAAEMRQNFYEQQLNEALATAQVKAFEASQLLPRADAGSREQVGRILQGQMEKVLGKAREQERGLWNEALKSVTGKALQPQGTQRAFLKIVSEITPERLRRDFGDLNAAMRRLGIVNDEALKNWQAGMVTREFIETGVNPAALKVDNVDPRQLIVLRSDLLDAARKAEANGEVGNAAKLGNMASAILDDLGKLEGSAYDNARQFSKTLNDAFTRTFARELDRTSRTGAEFLPPELIVQRAFKSGSDQTLVRFRELQDAAAFLDPNYKNVVEEYGVNSVQAQAARPPEVATVREALANALRLMAAETKDVRTGRINPDLFDKFMVRNQDTLRELNLLNEFRNISTAERNLLQIDDPQSMLNKSLREDDALRAVLGTDDVAGAIFNIIGSKTPVKGLQQLVALAKKSDNPKEAINGLKSAIFQYAYSKAGGIDDNFRVGLYERTLFGPLRKGLPGTSSLINMMRGAGVISLPEVGNLAMLLKPMVNIEKAVFDKTRLGDITPIGEMSPVEELMVAQLAARAAALASPRGPGSLSFAAKTMKIAGKIFNRMPAQQAVQLLQEVALDPEKTAMMLKRGLSQKQSRELGIDIIRRILAPGATRQAIYEYLDRPEEVEAEEEEVVVAPSATPPKPVKTGPATRGTGPTAPEPKGTPVSSAAPPAQQGQAALMYQQLFPQDPIGTLAMQRRMMG